MISWRDVSVGSRCSFLLLPRGDAGDVFLQLVVVFGSDEALSPFDGEHDMDIDSGVGVGHARKMPLRTELENLLHWFYKDAAPDGAEVFPREFVPARLSVVSP